MTAEDRDSRLREWAKKFARAGITFESRYEDAINLLSAFADEVRVQKASELRATAGERDDALALVHTLRATVAELEAGKREAEEERDTWRKESVSQHRRADEAEERADRHWRTIRAEVEQNAMASQRIVELETEVARLKSDLSEAQEEWSEERRLRISQEAEVARLRDALSKQDDEISQTLGKALGYPWFKDDQKSFPGATEDNGVCVGDEVAETLAIAAVLQLEALRRRVSDLERERDEARKIGRAEAFETMHRRLLAALQGTEPRDRLKVKLVAGSGDEAQLETTADFTPTVADPILDDQGTEPPDYQLDSPPSVPKELEEFKARDFQRINRGTEPKPSGFCSAHRDGEDPGCPTCYPDRTPEERIYLSTKGTEPKPEKEP
jgi:hypothetical protein